MSTPQDAAPTGEDRVMVALGHISAFLPIIGIIAPLVIWITQKDKSRFINIQSLQAILYHLVLIVCFFLGMLCYVVSIFGVALAIPLSEPSTNSPAFIAGVFIPFIVMGIMCTGWIGASIYAIVAALMTLQGRDFRYLVIGRLVERTLKN